MSHVMPNVPDAVQRREAYDLIVSTCHEVIRDCGDPQVRMEAARILLGLNPRPWGVADSGPWVATWGVE